MITSKNNNNEVLEIIKEIGVFRLSDSEGSCPCGAFEICGVRVEYHCWRVSCRECKYSGIHVFKVNPESTFDLQQVAEEVYNQITEIWNNTDWNISYNPR